MQNIKDFILIVNNRITKLVLLYMSFLFCIMISFLFGRMVNIKSEKQEVKIVQSNYLEEIRKDDPSEISIGNGPSSTTIIKNQNDKKELNKNLIFASSKGKYFY